MQMIFQDPISSLNPRRSVADIVAEPLNIWKRGHQDERTAKVDQVLPTSASTRRRPATASHTSSPAASASASRSPGR
jgi:ABC-type microcin C transport system duplicated ATPase subunit YejF